MDRRGFVRSTTLGALVGASVPALTGCGGAGARPSLLSGREADDLVRRLDRGLESARRGPSLFTARAPDAHRDRLARLGIEALVVADVARSIPANAELPPSLAARLIEELPVLDRCVANYGPLIAGMPLGARRNTGRLLARRPDAPMELAEWIDARAAEHAISHESRLRLRRLALDVTRRIRRQSLGAVVDDTVDKVERIIAHKGAPVALARQATGNAMLASVWQTLDTGVPPAGGSPAPPAPTPGQELDAPTPTPAVPWDPEIPPRPLPQPVGRGDQELMVGGILIGTGVGVFGIGTLIGWAVGSAVWGAIISATPGGILVVIGLIFLIIGAAQNA